MSTSRHHLTDERLEKIRSQIIQQKNIKEQNKKINNPALQRTIPCFCIKNNKHPKWKLCPIDMSPKLYFVNNVNNGESKNKKSNEKKNVGVLPPRSNLTKSMMLQSSTLLLNNNTQQKIPLSLSQKNDVTAITNSDAEMTLRFRIDSANTDRRKTLNKGFFKKGFYSAPRPHHFRDDIHRPVSFYYYCYYYYYLLLLCITVSQFITKSHVQ